ncbi:MAG: hypothetical protein ACE5F1_08865 [Planctomycetota bacterium]
MGPRKTLTWLILLVLVSAAGLLGVGVVNLWQALRSAETTARVENLKAAQATADGIRLALGQQEVLDVLRDCRRFELGPDGIVVPAELTWVKSPPVAKVIHSMRLE